MDTICINWRRMYVHKKFKEALFSSAVDFMVQNGDSSLLNFQHTHEHIFK